MLEGQAGATETAAFAERFKSRYASDFYSEALGLTLSGLGVGTNLGKPDAETDDRYAATLEAALAAGINHIDTAVNYRAQASERTVGRVLAAVTANGMRREEIVVATKGGYVPRDRDAPERGGDALFAGIPPEEIAGGNHCLASPFLERMLALSRENLGLATIDIYYLHNPEVQLGAVPKPVFYQRLKKAFAVLEAARKRGEIGCYGAATWSGFLEPVGSSLGLDLSRMVDTAKSVGGEDHGFRCIQLPVNLRLTTAVTLANQTVDDEPLSVLEAAAKLGLAVFTSGPLAQAALLREGLPERAKAVDPEGNLTPAQRALRFARSTGATCTLVGTASPEHLAENLGVAALPQVGPEAMRKAAGAS